LWQAPIWFECSAGYHGKCSSLTLSAERLEGASGRNSWVLGALNAP
jgi:hypothetical protein